MRLKFLQSRGGGEYRHERFVRSLDQDYKEGEILRLASYTEKTISSSSGIKTIASSKDVFKSGIDSDFMKINRPSAATEPTDVLVYETAKKNSTLKQMFCSLGVNLDELCLTQHQIRNFCREHFSSLNFDPQCPNFFLIKEDGQFYVVHVYVHTDGLYAYLDDLENPNEWGAENYSPVIVKAGTLGNKN